jgi:glucosamine-6-phosphate deaminase
LDDILNRVLTTGDTELPLPLRIADNDTVLYWWMALDMYREISADLLLGRETVFIVPVGPVYQYRFLIDLLTALPLNLSHVHLFFMDEYLDENDELVGLDHPLSFRGFINRELKTLISAAFSFRKTQIYFPSPAGTEAYDKELEKLGGATVCYAGVGINGHLAFNEAPSTEDSPSRIISLTPETITTNSHTALGGAYERIPKRAVTVGLKSILAAGRLSIWMNRPWQKTVVRKLLFGPIGPEFPASFARKHGSASLTITSEVAEVPQFGLR